MRKLFGWLKPELKYLIAAILLVVPLYQKFPSIRIPGTFVSVRLEDFLLAFAAIVALVLAIPVIKQIVRGQIEKSLFVYVAVGAASVLSAIFVLNTVFPHIAFLHWARRIEYFIPFFLGSLYLLKGKRADFEFFIKVLILVVFLVFIYGMGQRYLHWPIIITQNEEYSKGVALRWIAGSHINSTFAGHYDLATFLVMVLPIFVSLFFLIKDKISKIVVALAFFSGLWLLSTAVSRISVVSFLISGTLSLLIIKKYKAIAIFLAVSVIVFSLSTDLYSRYSRIIEVGREKINQLMILPATTIYAQEEGIRRINNITAVPTPQPVFEDRSTSIRLVVEWPRAIKAFYKNPAIGTGFSSITLATDNDYLRLLGETGILGFFSFVAILISLLAVYVSAIPVGGTVFEKAFLAGVIGSLPGILLNAVFIDVFEASKFAIIFWLLTGLAVGLIRNNKNGQNN